MRVLFVAFDPYCPATTRYRCHHLAEALRKTGAQVDIAWVGAARVRVAHDVVVLHRVPWKAAGAAFVRAARACGAAVIYSTDDLVFDPEYGYHAGTSQPDDDAVYRYHRSHVGPHAAMAREADGLLVSTEWLAERARAAFGPDRPVFVARNFLSDEVLCLSAEARTAVKAARRHAPRGDRITLAYLSGSPTHDADFADILSPLRRVLRRHGNVNLLLVGMVRPPAGLERLAGQIRRHPFLSWRDLPGLLAEVDINLAPLDLTRPFNHAKSEIKWLEAAAVGVPTVAAATAAYAEVVRDGENGFLVENRADWEPILDRLLRNPEEREAVTERAQAFLDAHAASGAKAASVRTLFEEMAALGGHGAAQRRAVTVNWPVSPRYTVLAAGRWAFRRWFSLTGQVQGIVTEQKMRL